MELRKRIEKEFHNIVREVREDEHVAKTRWEPALEQTIKSNPLWVNMKYYSIERKSRSIVKQWYKDNCKGKKVLDYCCGNGEDGFIIAMDGAKEVVGIDISDVSITNCIDNANRLGLDNISFRVMDAEALEFNDESFDIITEYGSLHHLNLNNAYSEMARVLRPDGKAICVEALGHNPIINLYRKLTPHLRTEWEKEHILRKENIDHAKDFFHEVDIIGFYHLATICAVPFRNSSLFNIILTVFESIDSFLLKLPFIKWHAWHVIFVLSEPKRG